MVTGDGEHRPGAGRRARSCRAAGAIVLAIVCAAPLGALTDSASPWPAVTAIALAVVSAAAPGVGFASAAALPPLGTVMRRLTGWPMPNLAETIVLAVLTGWFLRRALRPQERRRVAGGGVAVVLGAALAAWLIVQLTVRQLVTAYPLEYLDQLFAFVTREYLIEGHPLGGFAAGVILLEGVALYLAAAQWYREGPERARRLVHVVVLAATVAGLATFSRLVPAALRNEAPLAALAEGFLTLRVAVVGADLNAAGSFYALALPLATTVAATVGLAPMLGALAASAMGLWLSGSRTALAACVVGPCVVWLLGLSRSRRATPVIVLVVLGVMAVSLALLRPRADATTATPAAAVQIRRDLAVAALRLTASAPVFGIGPGQFPIRQAEVSPAPPSAWYARENTHNYVLQVFAEQGIVGGLLFTALLLFPLRVALLRLQTTPGDATVWSLCAGCTAFVLTSLAGHPFLLLEPSAPFWVCLGVLGSTGPAPLPRGRWLAPACAVLLLLSSVPRALAGMKTADLEHRGLGVSEWRIDDQGIKYRVALEPATLYVPSRARVIVVPIEWHGPAGTTADVLFEFDGAQADRLRLDAGRRRSVTVQMPTYGRSRRFRSLRLTLQAPRIAGELRIGKIDAR